MWLLLSGIRNKQEADAAAAKFTQLHRELVTLDQSLSLHEDAMKQTVIGNDELEYLSERIISSYQILDSEFDSLNQAYCLGSGDLSIAFQMAIKQGFFIPSKRVGPHMGLAPLKAAEARIELERMEKLLAPDKAILDCLCSVKDGITALQNAQALHPHIRELHKLRPAPEHINRAFPAPSNPRYQECYYPIERLLWGIRNEYVRIVAIQGYESADFDLLSSTLDELYLSIEETHPAWFAGIFDDSFLSDMDAAYRERRIKENTHPLNSY